jgi:triphosphatase
LQSTDHAVETEIKLRLSPDGRTALEQHPAFNRPHASAPETKREVSTYFDTPDYTLRNKGVTLRVRHSGPLRKQTVKVAYAQGQEPLQRGEWEWPVEQDVPDLGPLAETPVAQLARTVDSDELRPVFTTEIERTARLLRPDEFTTVEAALDEGRIIADGASAPVSEMELELKSGHSHSLYRLALDLLADVPLALETAGKPERGFWLRTGTAPEASKASHIRIDRSASTAEAVKLVVSSVLAHVLANVGPADRADREGVHQIRVGVRRLRAALALFEPHLHPVTFRGFNDELRRLGVIFGRARDWDVFAFETLPAAENDISKAARLHPLRDAAEAERAAAHRAISAELSAPSFARLVLGISEWIVNGAQGPLGRSKDALTAPVEDIAPDLLDRMLRKVAKRGRHIEEASREQLHALRKAIKKLRYGVEFLSGLYRHELVAAYLDRCEELQELLGTVNDAAVTPALLERLRESSEGLVPAINRFAEWATMRGEKARHRVSKPWHEFHSAAPFWS